MNAAALAIRVFATDLDDTIVDDPAGERLFRATWESLASASRPLLVYNSGRSVTDVQRLVLERRIPAPEFIIGGIGTELFDPLEPQAAEEFRTNISFGWDREMVLRIVTENTQARLQSPDFCNSHKLSWHWPRATKAEIFRLEVRLREAGLDVSIRYTADIFLDVLPRHAGKGNALAWLCRRIGVPLESVLVAGAGGNNGSMFMLPEVHGILVGNVSRDLLASAGRGQFFLTADKMAWGIRAGFEHFGVLQAAAQMEATPGLAAVR